MADENKETKPSDLANSAELANDEDSGITMVDLLEEEQELEDSTDAVLGGSDDKNCTYPQGYVKRQALYACNTCEPEGEQVGGICLACTYACHDGHDLFELYTKRNFRCDCGNSIFKSNPCKLFQGKDATNSDNAYNQNFRGLYCTCSRPYPDPDDEIEDEMIQCIVCEDWYHSRHLNAALPSEYEEMTCKDCVGRLPFLRAYNDADQLEIKVEIDVVGTSSADQPPKPEASEQPVNSEPSSSSFLLSEPGCSRGSSSRGDVSKRCKRPQKAKETEAKGALFWTRGWRNDLCSCDDCKKLYEDQGVLYLIDSEDTVHVYEEKGKLKRRLSEDPLNALSSLSRTQQVEAIQEFNNLKTELIDYLKPFAGNGKVVTREDIERFFEEQTQERKRRKTNVTHFCR